MTTLAVSNTGKRLALGKRLGTAFRRHAIFRSDQGGSDSQTKPTEFKCASAHVLSEGTVVDTVVHGSSGSDAGAPYPTVTLVELPYPTKVSPGSPDDRASLHSRAHEHRRCHAKHCVICNMHVLGWCQST